MNMEGGNMEEFGTKERLLCSAVTAEESKRIEKILQEHNISYFEQWNHHRLNFFRSSKNDRCDILVHMDSFERAKKAIG